MHQHDESEATAARSHRTPNRVEDATSVARTVADPANAAHAQVMALQRLAGNATVSRMLSPDEDVAAPAQRSPVLDTVESGGGTPLEGDLRSEMEGRLGGDFSGVKVHNDAKATDSAKSIDANAYTVGSDVVFRSDQWSPGSDEGKKTLAHELTHVMQQSAGPVSGTPVGGGLSVSDPSDGFEQAAERNADAAMAGPAPAAAAAAGPTAQGDFAQRQGADEEEEMLQGSFAQRQAEEEEELAQGSFAQREAAKDAIADVDVGPV